MPNLVRTGTGMIPLLRALALLGLLLLPIQMRAGAASPHPHALLHLLLDARDGAFDHHTVGARRQRRRITTWSTSTRPDSLSPTSPPTRPPSPLRRLAVLAVVVTMLHHSRARGRADMAAADLVAERLPVLEPPPPASGPSEPQPSVRKLCGIAAGRAGGRPSCDPFRRLAAVGSIALASTLLVLASPLRLEAHETRTIADGTVPDRRRLHRRAGLRRRQERVGVLGHRGLSTATLPRGRRRGRRSGRRPGRDTARPR